MQPKDDTFEKVDGQRQKLCDIPGIPNLSLTMYPFSIPTDEHVPLNSFD